MVQLYSKEALIHLTGDTNVYVKRDKLFDGLFVRLCNLVEGE